MNAGHAGGRTEHASSKHEASVSLDRLSCYCLAVRHWSRRRSQRCFLPAETWIGRPQYQVETPVDLSRQISDGLQGRMRGHHLVFVPSNDDCGQIGQGTGGSTSTGSSPPIDQSLDRMVGSSRGSAASYGYDSGGLSPSGRAAPGTDVRVRSYTRGDGTVVQSHTRAAPGRGR